MFETIALDLFLVQLRCLIIFPSCWSDPAGYIFSFNSNKDPIIISSIVLLSCEFMFLTREDGLFPGRLNIKPGCVAFYLQSSCFHFMVFLRSETDVLTAREQRWVSFSESSVHGNYVNIFLVTFILFLRQSFLDTSETEWGGLNVKHMYWQVRRHLLELSAHMLDNGFCSCYVFLAEPTTVLFKV